MSASHLRFPVFGAAWLLPLLLGVSGCASVQASPGATFVVVRHAEKDAVPGEDPGLNAAGQARAQALAQRLADAPLVAAYATPFRRTRLTAQPAATMHGIAVTTYDAATPAAELATTLRAEFRAGTVLLVGHSNTVPAIVASLCSCRIAALGEDDYDAIYTIRINPQGGAALQVGHQGFASTPAAQSTP